MFSKGLEYAKYYLPMSCSMYLLIAKTDKTLAKKQVRKLLIKLRVFIITRKIIRYMYHQEVMIIWDHRQKIRRKRLLYIIIILTDIIFLIISGREGIMVLGSHILIFIMEYAHFTGVLVFMNEFR